MQGVFGAGVLSYLSKIDFYTRLEAVYGGSAGALNGAYFLVNQAELGSTIYWENLTKNFISVKNFYRGVWERIVRVPKEKLHDAVDLNYLFEVIQKIKPLNIEKIINSQIPFFVKLFNLNLKQIEYKDARRKNIFEILRASTANVPYVHETHEIDGHEYIDGTIPEAIGYDFLRKKHPQSKIIFVYCGFTQRKFRYKIKNYIEGKIMTYMYDDSELLRIYLDAEQNLRDDLIKINQDPMAILVSPTLKSQTLTRTVKEQKLMATYKIGYEQASRLIN